MRYRYQLLSLVKGALVFAVLFMALRFVPQKIVGPSTLSMFAAIFSGVSFITLCAFLFLPVRCADKLDALHLCGRHGLRKTDANSFTYFVDHPPLRDGSLDMKQLRFFWECNGDEVETILPVDRVSLRVTEESAAHASVEFAFNIADGKKCGLAAVLTKNPNWWLVPQHSDETGFGFALITMTPGELASEIYLNSNVQYF